MNKLKELTEQGWIFSACYSKNKYGKNKFYLIASYGDLDITISTSHTNLEMAMIELYEKCTVTDDLQAPSPS